jgi:hypothetical protein
LHHARRNFEVILTLFITRLAFSQPYIVQKPVNCAMAELLWVQSTLLFDILEASICVYCLFDFTGYLIAHGFFSTT